MDHLLKFLIVISSTQLILVNCHLNLTIIHNNDIHSRYLPTTINGEDCEAENDVRCFGGIGKIVTKVRELRKQIPNLLFLNGGDTFTGTLYYSLFKWKLAADMVLRMRFDAMSFGNHEFDDGVAGLAPYLEATHEKVPTLACNVDVSNEPKMRHLVNKSKVFTVGGQKIAVIGYVTPDTAKISFPGHTLKFTDEAECIEKEVEKLKKENVKIFIAVGHSGFDEDKAIARKVPDLDVIVGGHTNTFLYNGKPPSKEVASDVYPAVVEHKDGRRTLVVQAYAYGKYLGFLNVIIDEKGEVVKFHGQPILLDHTVPDDPKIREFMLKKSGQLKAKYDSPIGKTLVLLDGDCRKHECNMGNFVTDMMLTSVISIKPKPHNGWAEYPCSFISGGFLRASIDDLKNNSDVTSRDVIRVVPFENKISGIILTGKVLKEVFEHSVHRFSDTLTEYEGEFLQVSGFKVIYDLSKPVGQRVVRLMIRCGECRVPMYEILDESKTYKVLTSDFMAGGGDLYLMLIKVEHEPFNKVIQWEMINYFKNHSPVFAGLEKRSKFVKQKQLVKDA
ncbi:5'-nucleotidase-like protein [Leptotrombidium deliense]|uniref:5'-nucleotidase-like protein n=1 Tax=Leptotrombidium deliense TaxID=299467 RepID=A0A443SL29_9ACAR|nr:5'-nucleotidase-like protein [Leptotrombidium deliense]